jgi:hypothetical protein
MENRLLQDALLAIHFTQGIEQTIVWRYEIKGSRICTVEE